MNMKSLDQNLSGEKKSGNMERWTKSDNSEP